MSAPVKIVIAEPSVIIRKGMLEILRRFNDTHFEVGEVGEAEHLRNQINWHKPAILLINPSFAGADAMRQFKKEARKMKCIALVSSLTDQSLLKDYDETVSLYDSADRIREKLTGLLSRPLPDKEENTLSPREKEVLVCGYRADQQTDSRSPLSFDAHCDYPPPQYCVQTPDPQCGRSYDLCDSQQAGRSRRNQ